MLIPQAKFHDIEAQWHAAFSPPYYAGAELGDYGRRLSFAVFKDEKKVFEAKDQIASDFVDPQVVLDLTRKVITDLALRFPDSPP